MPRKDVDGNTIDARSARIALMTYLRWAWVPVVALVAGFIVGGVFSTTEGPSSESGATMTIGLTEEVRWPFFDAVLSRQQGLIENGDLADAASASTGIENVSVVVESSNVQNSTLVIAATVRGSATDAATYADALGDLLVEANLASQRDGLVAEAGALTQEISEIQVNLEDLAVELNALEEQWITVQDAIVVAEPEDIAELRVESSDLDNDRRLVQRQIDAQLGLETSLNTQLTQAEITADQTGSPIEISSRAVAGESSATDLRPIFAVLFFLLSLIAIPFLEQAFGKVRSVDHLGNLWPEARFVDARKRRLQKATINPIDVARLAVVAESAPTERIAVGALGASKVTQLLASSLADQGTATSIVDLSSTQGMEEVVAADQLALVVPAGRVPLRRAHRSVKDLATLSATPVVVILASKDKEAELFSTVISHPEPASIAPESNADPSHITAVEIEEPQAAEELVPVDEEVVEEPASEEPVTEDAAENSSNPKRWGNKEDNDQGSETTSRNEHSSSRRKSNTSRKNTSSRKSSTPGRAPGAADQRSRPKPKPAPRATRNSSESNNTGKTNGSKKKTPNKKVSSSTKSRKGRAA